VRFPITVADTDLCIDLRRSVGGSVRGALHVAAMRNNAVEAVATYDVGFDVYGVQRWPLD